MLLAKILDPETGMIDIEDVDSRETAKITELRTAGYLDFMAAERPAANEGEKVIERLDVSNDKIVQSWDVMAELIDSN